MFSESHATCIVDRIGYCRGYCTDCRFGEALSTVEPAWLQAINEHLSLFRHIHDRGKPVRQVADAIVTGTWKLAIPWNRIGRDLSTLHQRSFHVAFCEQRINDQTGIVAVGRPQKFPVTGPRIHLNLDKAGPDALVECPTLERNAPAGLSYDRAVCPDEFCEGGPLPGIF